MAAEQSEAANEVEAKIIEVWKSVFDVEDVGRHDNFFDLGGHSLNATQVAWRLKETFNVEVPVRTIFDAPTVAELAESVLRLLVKANAKPNE
jgi:acyl carrier protein